MEQYYQKQLNESYNGKLNELFKEWKASYPESERAADRFCEDGLTLKYKEEESGYDINEVANQAGHSNIHTTLLYTNPTREKMKEKANRL